MYGRFGVTVSLGGAIGALFGLLGGAIGAFFGLLGGAIGAGFVVVVLVGFGFG